MLQLPQTPSRKEVLRFISDSATYGNLGAFIGAGFSKAVLNDNSSSIALSWGELLQSASEDLDVDYESIPKIGVGFPEIASSICKKHADQTNREYAHSVAQLKYKIAESTSWYPDGESRDEFSKYLIDLSLAWIITTNYDLVIESLLTGKSIPLGPNDSLVSPDGIIPVFHLHGLRTNPEEIIICQEDYVSLFRPSEYRQIKLALTIRESTTLFIGYGLGDVNVLTAIDWSRNVFNLGETDYPCDVIQLLRQSNPTENPYRDRNGIVIIETEDISSFFTEIGKVRRTAIRKQQKERKAIQELSSKLNDPNGSMIRDFIDDSEFRSEVLNAISKFPIYLISGFVSLLNKCIDEALHRSAPSGAFKGYDEALIIILDILTAFPMKRFPPALFQTAAYGLERVGYYVGAGAGKSWSAHKTWLARKSELSNDVIAELRSLARQHGYVYLKRLATQAATP